LRKRKTPEAWEKKQKNMSNVAEDSGRMIMKTEIEKSEE
jgi:DNA replication protein DnaD